MNVITELPQGALTLRPATNGDRLRALAVFPLWESEDDGRFVVDSVAELDDEWESVVTEGGLHLEVRRADCGAGCRCAGEFRFRPDGDDKRHIHRRRPLYQYPFGE